MKPDIGQKHLLKLANRAIFPLAKGLKREGNRNPAVSG